MKKKSYFLVMMVVILLIGIGAFFILRNIEKNGFSGKYINGDKELVLYQNSDNELYYVISNVYGKATVNNNEATDTKNNTQYKFVLKENMINLSSSNTELNGDYQKEKSIDYDEFYKLAYGDKKYFDSKYNGIFTYQGDVIKMYQSNENEVIVFLNNLDKKKGFLRLAINENKETGEATLYTGYNDKTHMFITQGKDIVYVINDQKTNKNVSEMFFYESKLTEQDIINLFMEY